MTSSYGTLVSDTVVRDDGRLSSILYGDVAQTRTELQYNDARADAPLSHMTVQRNARPSAWDQPGYLAEDALAPTQQLVLTDTAFEYDGIANPTEIRDDSLAPWALGAASRTRTVAYDDNRVNRVTYTHTESTRVSRFAHEAAQSSDRSVPQASLPARTAWQEFAYDYLGNIKSSTSDAGPAGRFDRALGTPTYGTSTDGPNQLKTADGVRASYDSAGNLVDLIVERPGPCDDGRPCSQRTRYDWDELGQLLRARRWDLTLTPGTLADDPALVSGDPAWDLGYAYSGGQRVLKSAKAAGQTATDATYTLEVFDSLRVEHTAYESGDYARTVDTEKLNLAGVGRVQKVAGTTPDGQTDQPRLFLAIGDELGSASFVIDHQTSEVVERTSFDAYGTVDSDFRSERWGAYRNPHQFTGKEEDIEVGLVYFGARYYHPQLHRWMSPDPLTIHAWGADPNPYAYVSGNVLRLTDPTGLCPENCPPPPAPGPPDGWIGTPGRGGPGADAPAAPGTGGGHGGGSGLAEAPKPPPPPPPQSSLGTSLTNQLVQSIVTRASYLSAPVYGQSGVRLGGGVRPLRSVVAQGFKGAGYNALAAIAEAGHGCALCHLIKAHQTLGEADAAIDLAHYDSVAVGVASMRDALVLTILTEGAVLALRGPGAGAAAAEQASALRSLCFAEGTMVLMADGSTKRIEDVREDDKVIAHDPQDGRRAEPRRVTQVHRTATYRLFHLEIGSGGEIVATGSHPFWTQRGWVTAEELTSNDHLSDELGRAVSIRAIAIESRDAPTFNLSVEGAHTFFVVAGKTAVLVHNVDPWDVLFTQPNYGATFAEGDHAGRTLAAVAADARAAGRLPDGLTLNATRMADGRWATLNNRTLAVARMANLPNVSPVDAGDKGFNVYQRLLRDGGLSGPVENAVMRCR